MTKRLPYLDNDPPTLGLFILLLICVAAFSFVLGMFAAALIVGGF